MAVFRSAGLRERLGTAASRQGVSRIFQVAMMTAMISLGKREPKWYNSVQSKNENGTLMNFEN